MSVPDRCGQTWSIDGTVVLVTRTSYGKEGTEGFQHLPEEDAAWHHVLCLHDDTGWELHGEEDNFFESTECSWELDSSWVRVG